MAWISDNERKPLDRYLKIVEWLRKRHTVDGWLKRLERAEAKIAINELVLGRFRELLKGRIISGSWEDVYENVKLLTKPNSGKKVLDGAGMIESERQRQIVEEGWDPKHDDKHDDRELALAAKCYLDWYVCDGVFGEDIMNVWPWAKEWWKPTTDIRDLVKAGALIAAEIDRLKRSASQ